jgi:fumarylacetoacetate (FAA) hydrolase
MRLATVFDRESNEPRPVFELPSGRRVELRELFRPDDHGPDDELGEVPLYFTDLAKTVEFLDDVTDAVRQWARERAEHAGDLIQRMEQEARPTPVDAMPFLPPVPVVRGFREFDVFEPHVKLWRTAQGTAMHAVWYEAPTFAFASAASLLGHGSPVYAPLASEELDYGLQLGLIVGRGGRDILGKDAWKHVAGFTIVNGFVARDIERQEMSAACIARGKSRDFASAVGPYLVSLSALGDRIDADDRIHLAMRAIVNGKELSRADSSAMYFTWPQLIEHASRDAELSPGDLITSGTAPTGSILDLRSAATNGSSSVPWLKAGDVVELEVERLGALRTPIIERPAGTSTIAARNGAAAASSQRRETLVV